MIVKAVSTSNRGGLSKIVGIAEKKELVVKRRGFRESKIQLFTHEELKRLLEKVGFVNVRLNSILTTTHFLPKTFVKKHFREIVELEKKLSQKENMLPLTLRIHFKCNKP